MSDLASDALAAAFEAATLALDGVTDQDVEAIVDLAVDFGISALPLEVNIEGITFPVSAVAHLLRPALSEVVRLIVDASKPKRVDITAPEVSVKVR